MKNIASCQKKELDSMIRKCMVTREYMDNHIEDIYYRVLIGTLPPEDMRIVERYKEYKKKNKEFKEVDYKISMKQLIE